MVIVTVSEGLLEGELIKNEFGGTFYGFKGMPYAEPPIGDLRFKAPQSPKPWHGIRSAKRFGQIICQVDFLKKNLIYGSEDCLYINVYTPDTTPKKPFPVMFWIPGGGFVRGSGNDDFYGPEFLVKKDVILVTHNYRLGNLGFLSLQTKDIPGNAGMKDQVAALRWVNKNISNFGGDPHNITLSGQSSAAGCISYHMVSPMTNGLFKRVIAQSGSALATWAITFEPRERAHALARKLGCYSEDDKVLYNFFKSQPVEALIEAKLPITLVEDSIALLITYQTIVSEKEIGDQERFFYGDILDTKTNKIHDNIEIMTGYNEHEGLLQIVTPSFNLDTVMFQANNLHDFLIPKIASFYCPMTEQVEIRKKIKRYYFEDGILTMNNLLPLVKFYSFDWFIYSQLQFVRMCAGANMTIYLNKFTCKSERNVFLEFSGVRHLLRDIPVTAHSDDLTYLFPLKAICRKIDKKSKSFKLIDIVTTLWTNFAKYGNPTPDDSLGVKWTPYNLKEQDYLEIGNKLLSKTAPEKEELEFWDDIYKQYLPQLHVNMKGETFYQSLSES